MKYACKIIIIVLGHFVLIPHLIFYFFSSQKKAIFEDIMQSMNRRSVKFSGYLAVVYILMVDSFYRTMFYHRIGLQSLFFKWYFPGNNTFKPMCDNIGGGIYLAHPISSFLNAKSIGKNFTCRQNTTLGNKYEGDISSRPTIGDNVSLGANVVIIGDVIIGNNVIVGAGSVVTKSIPNDSVVVGNPAHLVFKTVKQKVKKV